MLRVVMDEQEEKAAETAAYIATLEKLCETRSQQLRYAVSRIEELERELDKARATIK